MQKALYFEILNYDKNNLKLLKENFELITYRDPFSIPEEVLVDINIIFAPLGYSFGKKFIDSAPALKVIATNTTGIPHIDAVYARNKGIKVISLAGQTNFLKKITPTAELTIGLIIALTRKIPWAFKSVLEGRWNRWDFGGPAMLSSMSLGIVGLGRLGKMVAKYAQSFGMSVSYCDPDLKGLYPKNRLKKRDDLKDLVSSADIVTVHIPIDENNRNLFNHEVFSEFKDKSYFINTSRGEIVDSQALIDFLKNGHIAGAAVDVLSGEFHPDFSQQVHLHPLVAYAKNHENLIITPHIAGSTQDAWFLTQKFIIERAIKAIV